MLDRVCELVRIYLDAVPHPRQRLPRVIQFPINDICNSRCQMCHIWQQKLDWQISPPQVRQVLSKPVFRKVRDVGINGGEPTLRKDLPELTRAVVTSLPAIRSIALITNAIRSEQVVAAVDDMGRACHDHGVKLDVMVSLDGVGAVHDRVRGVPGNFDTACRVLDHLDASPHVDSHRIGCTVIKENVYDVENVLDWCIQRNIYARFRLGIPHQRLYTLNIIEPFSLDDDQRYHFACFLDHLYHTYETQWPRRVFYRSLRDQIIYGKPRAAGCAWKNVGVTLGPHGELAYCAVRSKTLGSAIDQPPGELFWANREHLAHIVEHDCDDCHHDYEGLADRGVFVRQVLERAADRLSPKLRDWLVHTMGRRRQRRLASRALHASRKVAATAVKSPGRAMLIVGWYGTETLGDKAILAGVIDVAREALGTDLRIDIASLEPYITRQTCREMFTDQVRSVIDYDQALRNIHQRAYGIITVGGGPLMSTIEACGLLLQTFAAGRRHGAATVIAGCGVGPLPDTPLRPVIKRLLDLSDYVVLRDQASAALAREILGYTSPTHMTLDPAFLWATKQLRAHADSDVTGNVCGDSSIILALRRWTPGEYARDLSPEACERIDARFNEQLRLCVNALLAREKITINALAMHRHAVGGDDRWYLRQLLRGLSDHDRVLLSMRHDAPTTDFTRIMQSRAIMAMRYHSVVLALAARRPVLAIDYTRGGKTEALMHELGLADQLMSIEDFDGQAAANRLLRWIDHGYTAPDLQAKITDTRQTLREVFSRAGSPA